MEFGKYLVFADESGDHLLNVRNNQFPIFVLAFCIFDKQHYCDVILPEFNKLKLKYFNDLSTVFHERDIRKAINEFAFLTDTEIRERFFTDLNDLLIKINFTVISAVIDKRKLVDKYFNPGDPYSLAMRLCTERLLYFMHRKGTLGPTAISFETRGRTEDNTLELAFLREVNRPDYNGKFSIRFMDKKANNCGLQLADLVARPIGRYVLDKNQPNRAFDILRDKLDCKNGKIENIGLKIFP